MEEHYLHLVSSMSECEIFKWQCQMCDKVSGLALYFHAQKHNSVHYSTHTNSLYQNWRCQTFITWVRHVTVCLNETIYKLFHVSNSFHIMKEYTGPC